MIIQDPDNLLPTDNSNHSNSYRQICVIVWNTQYIIACNRVNVLPKYLAATSKFNWMRCESYSGFYYTLITCEKYSMFLQFKCKDIKLSKLWHYIKIIILKNMINLLKCLTESTFGIHMYKIRNDQYLIIVLNLRLNKMWSKLIIYRAKDEHKITLKLYNETLILHKMCHRAS